MVKRGPVAGPDRTRLAVVALVAAFDSARTVGQTVAALRALPAIDDVVVIDDGSRDATSEEARTEGARVLRLPENVGKGVAVRAGVEATPDAGIYLLVDADVGPTAGLVERLLSPVQEGAADMTVAVLPAAGRAGGLGLVRDLAAAGIRRGSGFRPRAALSGQRAVLADLLRSLPLADRFGLETAMTLDAVRAGARVVEVEVEMTHHHRGRSMRGFAHRAGQGVDIVRALWPRLTTPAQRIAAMVAAFVLLAGAVLWAGGTNKVSSVPIVDRPSKVLMFGMPRLGWADVGNGAMPNLDRLLSRGAVGALSPRSAQEFPSTNGGYVTLGTAAAAKARPDSGRAEEAGGGVKVPAADALARLNDGLHLSTEPGALGEALAAAGLRTAVVGNPRAALAVMDSQGSIGAGEVRPVDFTAAVGRALASADVVLADPGYTDEVGESAEGRRRALAETDRALGDVAAQAGPGTVLVALSVSPPGDEWRLTPLVASGRGVHPGYLHSPSTLREGLVILTDLAPTVLGWLGAAEPEDMIGHTLRFRPGPVDLKELRDVDRDAAFREDHYIWLTTVYVIFQAVVYLGAALAFNRLGGVGRRGSLLRWVVLAISAWPLATFLLRLVPDAASLGGMAIGLLVALDLVLVAVATKLGRRPLAPLAWICGTTVVVLIADVATGGHLQMSSFLGYSPLTAARFTGLGNAAFAALASSTILAAALHVHHAPRRREAVVATGLALVLVLLVDGAPSLGSDVGGILTLVPVFALFVWSLAGRRLSLRVVLLALAGAILALAVATGVDLLRSPESRTHLGRLAARVADDGWEPFRNTVERKLAGNVRTFGSPWTWVVPIVAVYGLWVLGRARGWVRLLPPGSPLRAGAIGVLSAGLLGCALNDSGVVVTAVVFVYFGPFLTLLALERERGPARLDNPEEAARAPAAAPT
jgi:hypothetical protein